MPTHMFRFVCGVNTGLQTDLDLVPTSHREQQRALVERISLDGWEAMVPELYADQPTDSRPPERDQARLRRWTNESIGITRLPVGLARLVESEPAPSHETGPLPVGWALASRSATIWPNGVAVVDIEFHKNGHGGLDVAELSADWDGYWDGLSQEVISIARDTADALAVATGTAVSDQYRGVDEDSAISRHRMWVVDAQPTEDLLTDVRENLVLIGRDTEFVDVDADEDFFCFPGNGFSVEIGLQNQQGESVLAPVARYYQYWVITTTMTDDKLHGEFARISNLAAHDALLEEFALVHRVNTTLEAKGESLKDSAREQFFAHRDVLNAMSPRHLAAWQGYVRSWRIPELEDDLQEKIVAIEDIGHRLREEIANNIAAKTTAVVTLLTALTLVSITTGVAAFVWTDDRLAVAARVWLVGVSILAAILLFVVSIRPTLVEAKTRRRFYGANSDE